METEGFLTGAVSFTPLAVENGIRLTAGVDEEGGGWLNTDSGTVSVSPDGTRTGIGAFAGYTEIPKVDFPDNDVQAARGGVRWQRQDEHGQTDVLIGHQDKTFGARGYYGVSDSLRAEEQTQDTLALGAWQSSDPNHATTASMLVRQFEDDYRLWLPDSLFRNEHRSRQAAGQVSRRVTPSSALRIHSRLAADFEDIDSNSLGDFSRSRLAATVLPEIDLGEAVLLTAGIRAEVLESFQDQWLPQVRLDIFATQDVSLYAEYSASVRRPSYTELNYESPGSLGNSGLDLQHQDAVEGGVRWSATANTDIRAVVFAARTEDTVDWIRPDAEASRWQAENIGTVDTLGSELSITHRLDSTLNLLGSWMWTDKDADTPPSASRYSLDYAENLIRVQLDWSPTDWMRLELAQLFRDQAENVLRTKGGNQQFLTNAAIHLRHPDLDRVQFSLMVWNATDDEYRVFAGQDTVSGRRVSAAVTVEL
jgi:iron complex outermembrane receptor protein